MHGCSLLSLEATFNVVYTTSNRTTRPASPVRCLLWQSFPCLLTSQLANSRFGYAERRFDSSHSELFIHGDRFYLYGKGGVARKKTAPPADSISGLCAESTGCFRLIRKGKERKEAAQAPLATSQLGDCFKVFVSAQARMEEQSPPESVFRKKRRWCSLKV